MKCNNTKQQSTFINSSMKLSTSFILFEYSTYIAYKEQIQINKPIYINKLNSFSFIRLLNVPNTFNCSDSSQYNTISCQCCQLLEAKIYAVCTTFVFIYNSIMLFLMLFGLYSHHRYVEMITCAEMCVFCVFQYPYIMQTHINFFNKQDILMFTV